MMRRSLRKGFSLAEILIAMVLIGVVSAAFIRVIVVQSRYYDQQNAKRGARSVARNSMNVILSDLRMVQDTLGVEFISDNGRTLRVRVPYAFGLVCASSALNLTASMVPVDSAVAGMAEYGGYAWRNATTGLYTYVAPPAPTSVNAPAAGTAATCTGSGVGQARIATVNVNGRNGSIVLLTPGDISALPTNPVFYWQRITYQFAPSTAFSGKWGLYRQVGTRATEEIMGPFDDKARFRTYWAGDDTSRTVITLADTARIKGLDIVLSGVSQKVAAGMSGPAKARIVSSVFFKNVRSF